MKLPDSVTHASRLAVITGACGGIGADLARGLDADGWATVRIDVVAADRVDSAEFSHPTVYVCADSADSTAMRSLGKALVSPETPRQDFLGVAAAGVISVGMTEMLSREEWDRIVRVNLTGTFVAFQNFIAPAKAARTGRLVAVASDAGKVGEAWLPHYSASKFGVIGLVQSLSRELLPDGVTVNAVCPSIVDTPMMQQLAEQMSRATGDGDAETWRRRFVEEVPAGRACLPRDVTHAVKMLAQPESEFLTGQSVNVSGGKVMH